MSDAATRPPELGRGVGQMALGAATAVAIGLCIKAAQPGLTTETVVFLRFALALVVLAPLWVRYAGAISASPRVVTHVVRGGAASLAVGLYFYTVSVLPLASAMAIQFTAPLFVPPLAALVLRERTRAIGYLGVLLSVAGAVMAAGPEGHASALPAVAGLLSAAIGAGLMVHGKRMLNLGESLVTIAFWFTLAGAACSGAYLLLAGDFVVPGASAIAFLGIGGALGTLAQIFVLGGYRCLPPALFAGLKLLPIPLGTFLAWAVFGEVPGALATAGIAIIAVGLGFAHLESRRTG